MSAIKGIRGGSMFTGKSKANHVTGILSDAARVLFEARMRELVLIYKGITGVSVTRASDGDVLEYVLRGKTDTRRHLRARLREQTR